MHTPLMSGAFMMFRTRIAARLPIRVMKAPLANLGPRMLTASFTQEVHAAPSQPEAPQKVSVGNLDRMPNAQASASEASHTDAFREIPTLELSRLRFVEAVPGLGEEWVPTTNESTGGTFVTRRYGFSSYFDCVQFSIKALTLLRSASCKPTISLVVDPAGRWVEIGIPTVVGLLRPAQNDPTRFAALCQELRALLKATEGSSTPDAEALSRIQELDGMLRPRVLPHGLDRACMRIMMKVQHTYSKYVPKTSGKKGTGASKRYDKGLWSRHAAGSIDPSSPTSLALARDGGRALRDDWDKDIDDHVPVPIPESSEIKEQVDVPQQRAPGDERLEDRTPLPIPSMDEMGHPAGSEGSERWPPRPSNLTSEEQSGAVETDGRSIEGRVPFPVPSSSEMGGDSGKDK
ncbi:hypothetical protein ACQY0O_007931 [Thecaphora frezii]